MMLFSISEVNLRPHILISHARSFHVPLVGLTIADGERLCQLGRAALLISDSKFRL
jgi:hypothetical protein